jgi:D-glycero-D-manno-heptose 1,7-bisphosphate phosphatase
MASVPCHGGRRAVFLDRDGTVNQEKEYLHRIEDFEFIPGAPEAMARLREAGFLLVVVTNQSGVARGYYSVATVDLLHRHIDAELARLGTSVDGWYLCPHHPGADGENGGSCSCRKPLPGMLLQAAADFSIDLGASFMVGDKLVDVEAALAAGCTPILVRTGYGADEEKGLPPGIAVADDLPAAAELIITRAGHNQTKNGVEEP